ncbi:TNFAIP3-interacting protein 1-like isoform X1 [Orbicella faveolata]|uniref:TNFAIP3-interacting protein 1-like isoform X1 n=1 Tax=Orbicella faveolata TaxID=48498 RepID=UPI0009E196EE|nr:TNFAIP3-interacting protein 1-like isoform X1 [Orbicella faveolata]
MEETRNNEMPIPRLAELQKEIERLSSERNQYLDTLSNSDILKLQLRETRKDAKLLSKQRKKLQAMADIEGANEETPEQPQEDQTSKPENHIPSEINLGASEEAFLSREQTYSFPSEENFSPPLSPQDSGMNGHISPALPASSGIAKTQKSPEWGALDAKTEANALRIENRDLVRIKRKQEEQVRSLVQEVGTLGTRCKELESIAQRLETENHRLSQQLVHSSAQNSYNFRPHEEMELLRAQLKVYEDDFKKERSERENLNTQKERLKRELSDAKATIAGLQRQLKQALNGEGGYGEPRDMHGPIMSEPYYEPYVVRHPLDYGMARTYSGGYIGPGASKDVLRRGQTPYVRKAFLSPDMTAVIDRDVVDGSAKDPPKSI